MSQKLNDRLCRMRDGLIKRIDDLVAGFDEDSLDDCVSYSSRFDELEDLGDRLGTIVYLMDNLGFTPLDMSEDDLPTSIWSDNPVTKKDLQ